ncbi:hypothetical protein [Mycolicibacterium tusciae]|uniref:hypothetical protein n=1 Tax=Mycolicibacterium tusciae TaxID=75922 RepID=UPI00024A25DA
MGQALSGALLDANCRTTVWNRTEAKADPDEFAERIANNRHDAGVDAGVLVIHLAFTCG